MACCEWLEVNWMTALSSFSERIKKKVCKFKMYRQYVTGLVLKIIKFHFNCGPYFSSITIGQSPFRLSDLFWPNKPWKFLSPSNAFQLPKIWLLTMCPLGCCCSSNRPFSSFIIIKIWYLFQLPVYEFWSLWTCHGSAVLFFAKCWETSCFSAVVNFLSNNKIQLEQNALRSCTL